MEKVLVYGWMSVLAVVDAARILAIFPLKARSHFSCGEGVIRSLYNAGHQITFITPFPDDESLKNYTVVSLYANTTIDVKKLSMNKIRSLASVPSVFIRHTKYDHFYCHYILNLKEMQEMLNSNVKKYDIMFLEVTYMHECFLPLAQKFDIPVIGLITQLSWKLGHPPLVTGYTPSIGNPSHIAFSQFEIISTATERKFWNPVLNTLYNVYTDLFYYFVIRPNIKTLYEQYYPAHLWYKKKMSLMFYNSHHTIFSRDMVPNAIEIGGIHLKPANPLTQVIKKFIEDAEHGVILFTLGSLVPASSMGPEMLNAFKDAFAAIPQRVIWKYEDDIEGLSDNILTMSWVPQRDILAHKNVKAFITHGGISGVYEAISEGKPMVLTPIVFDQPKNTAILVELGVGVYIDVDSISKEVVLEALNDVINDTRYWDRMQDLSQRFKDRPMTPQETVVYWTEYVLRHNGAPHLRTKAADMPLYQYFLLDVILIVATILLAIVFVLFIILRKIFVLCIGKKKVQVAVKIKRS